MARDPDVEEAVKYIITAALQKHREKESAQKWGAAACTKMHEDFEAIYEMAIAQFELAVAKVVEKHLKAALAMMGEERGE